MNIVRQESSSPSSGEDQSDSSAYLGAMPTGISEEHFNKHCKYKRYQDTVQGITAQFHIRNCKCNSDYIDRSELAQSKMDFDTADDGKEIHFDQACIWLRRKVKRCGQPAYVLEKYCNGCIMPLSNAPLSVMNMIQSSN